MTPATSLLRKCDQPDQTQEIFLQNESVNIKSEEDSLVGVDLATVATNLTPAADCNRGHDGSSGVRAATVVGPSAIVTALPFWELPTPVCQASTRSVPPPGSSSPLKIPCFVRIICPQVARNKRVRSQNVAADGLTQAFGEVNGGFGGQGRKTEIEHDPSQVEAPKGVCTVVDSYVDNSPSSSLCSVLDPGARAEVNARKQVTDGCDKPDLSCQLRGPA